MPNKPSAEAMRIDLLVMANGRCFLTTPSAPKFRLRVPREKGENLLQETMRAFPEAVATYLLESADHE